MSHGGQDNQGTGLKDVFGILVKTPQERLLSLTFQLGESPEDNIVHALSLIILQKEERALDKLQRLKDNYLATYLAERWQMSGGKLEDFAVHCGHFQELAGESLALLARIFKVLSEQRLCDAFLRNLAYRRALSSDSQKSSCVELGYDHFTEEAKVVCGPQITEWAGSSSDLKSGPHQDPLSSLDERIKTLKVTPSQDQSESTHSLPSPLQATSSMPSYPTHLEISISPTALIQDDRVTPETSDESKLKTKPALLDSECEAKDALGQPFTSQPASSQPHSKMDETSAEGSKSESLFTPDQTTKLSSVTNICLPMRPLPYDMPDCKVAEEEEEAIFYAFVILHAQEDEDMAESMREKIEAVIGSDGATFSGEFAIAGKSVLRCIEDAIDNSAFTLLLLTRNFNARLLEMGTDSALINSIYKRHKYNTVIPLLPHENCMPKMSFPIVLKTLIPLEENKNFGKKIKKLFSSVKIQKQRKIWNMEQTEKRKMELKSQKQQKMELTSQKQQIKECPTAQSDGRVHRQQQQQQQQQQPNIHIENAQYIMIGNDSQMTVDFGGGADKDDSEEQQ